MSENSIYRDLAERTGGSYLLGVVGPVRTGKSTFIKRFMETLVLPNIEDPYARERARDELPQSASGRTVMTAEPKFIPEEAAQIRLDGAEISVRLIDCVGYMVEGAAGLLEDGEERMVTTPWFDHEISMSQAAELGTEKVVREHSSIGIVITTDGSFGDIPRENYLEAEERVIRELQEIGKPFTVILNSADPDSPDAEALSELISERYGVSCVRLNCLRMSEKEIASVLQSVLDAFPISSVSFDLPDWIEALPAENPLKQELLEVIRSSLAGVRQMKDVSLISERIRSAETVENAELAGREPGRGSAALKLSIPRSLFYQAINEQTRLNIHNDGELIASLSEMASVKGAYDRIKEALRAVDETGYGVVMPSASEMRLEEPQIVRQNGKYSVRLRASAPAIHMLRTDVETEVTPAIGGESASEDIISFLLQGFDGDVNRIWESNIFGRSLNELAEEGLSRKIDDLPEDARTKLRETLQRIVNEGCGGLICILL